MPRIVPVSRPIQVARPTIAGTGYINQQQVTGTGALSITKGVVAGGDSAWADATVGFTSMPAQLGGVDGKKVRMDITGTDWGVKVDTPNGASVTRATGQAYDGTDAIKIVPPAGSTPNADQTYSCIMFGLDISNGGAKDAAQVNLGFCIAYGSRYWDLAHTAKVTGIEASTTLGGEPQSAGRAAIFENFKNLSTSDLRRLFCVTATTVQSYNQPVNGFFPEDGTDATKLLILGSTSNHANDPPLVATEWLYFEQETDYRQNRGNANGRNRLDVWARDGYLGYLEIPLTHNGSWNFAYQYARQIEYIGALWNNPGTANANNFLMVSHPIVSLNRAKDARIGPPPGFLT